jgi:hypothetical protein
MANTAEIIFMNTNSNESNKPNPSDEKKSHTAPIAPGNSNEQKEKVLDKPNIPDPKVAPPSNNA